MWLIEFLLYPFPGRSVFLGAVASGEVKKELIMIGFLDEVGPVGEVFDLIEFLFHQVVNGFDIGLEAVLSGGNSSMDLPGNALDGIGESRIIFGLPGADEFAAVIGLPGGGGKIGAAGEQVFDDALGEDGGVGERQFVGVAEEQKPCRDIACGVLILGKIQSFEGPPIFGNIAEILGVDIDLLKEPPLFFDFAEESFGLRFFASPGSAQAMIAADAADRFDAVGQGEFEFES